MRFICPAFFAAFFAAALTFTFVPGASAVPSGQPRVTLQGKNCVRIATAGVDHGKEVAQKYADDLLAADLEAFRKKRGIRKLRIQRRFKKCQYHLWFFGDEFNCTSLAVACW